MTTPAEEATRDAMAALTAIWDPDAVGPRVDLAVAIIRRSTGDPVLLATMLAVLAERLMQELEEEAGDGAVAHWLHMHGRASVLRGDGPART